MHLELFLALLALAGVTAAAYTDLTENVVPNTLTFPLIGGGILVHLALGAFRSDLYLALFGLAGATTGFLLSFPLYHLGGFGGGDVKLMAAVGALLPTAPAPVAGSSAAIFASVPLFPLTVLVDGLVVSSPFIAGYALLCLLRGEGISAKKVTVPDLKPGMVPAEAVWVTDGEVKRGSSLPKDHEECLADPTDAQSLKDQQIVKLTGLQEEGKFDGPLEIERTFPFAPVITAGSFFAVFLGNIYWLVLA